MGSPRIRRVVMKIALASLALVLSTFLLNIVLTRTGALGGISLTEALADEFRIRFLFIPANSRECHENRTHMVPNCEGEFYGNNVRLPKSHIRINSLGFRGREYPIEKGGTTFRIFMVGDSFTFGEGVNDDETYAHIIEQRLNALSDGTVYEIFNLGVPGAATDNEYQRLLQYLQYSPDLIVLQTLSDDIFDCESLYTKMNEALGIPDERSVFLPKTRKMAETRWKWDLQRQDYISQLGLDERCSCVRLYFERIVNTTREMSVPLIIYNLDWDGDCFEGIRGYYTLIKSEPWERRYRVSRRDSHLNAAGHELVAQMLLPALIGAMNSTERAVPT